MHGYALTRIRIPAAKTAGSNLLRINDINMDPVVKPRGFGKKKSRGFDKEV
jgi:hypothetical protein